MKTRVVILTDSEVEDGTFLGDFLPYPHEFRQIATQVSECPFDINSRLSFPRQSLRYVQECMLTRMLTVGVRLELYHVMVNKLRAFLSVDPPDRLVLRLHRRNRVLARFLATELAGSAATVETAVHTESTSLELSVTESTGRLREAASRVGLWISLVAVGFGVIALVIAGRLLDAFRSSGDIDGEHVWMGFANNREKVDYRILREFRERGLIFHYPDFDPRLLIKVRCAHRRSVFRMAQYNVRPLWLMLGYGAVLFKYQRSFRRLLGELREQTGLVCPTVYSARHSFTMRLHHMHYLLMSLYLQQIFSKKSRSTQIIFRGGNASGMYYAGLNSPARHEVIHMCHGTEVRPSNHSVHKLMDRVILASDEICELWAAESGCPRERFLPLGRPYYQVLGEEVGFWSQPRDRDGVLNVLVVLTYGRTRDMDRFARDVVSSFSTNPGVCTRVLIKQRPNLRHELPLLSERLNVREAPNSIFESLRISDVVVSSISDRGILSMVGLDAIYCGLPAIYYLPGLSPNSAGYSWNSRLGPCTFFSKEEMQEFVSSQPSGEALLQALRAGASEARALLGDSSQAIEKLYRYLAGRVESPPLNVTATNGRSTRGKATR